MFGPEETLQGEGYNPYTPSIDGRLTQRLAPEPILLILAGVFLFINFTALTLLRPETWTTNLLSFGVWVLCAVIGHRMLNRLLPGRDAFLFPVSMLLCGWGLVIIDRLLPRFADRQTLWLILSTVSMLGVIALPQTLRWLRGYRYLWLVFGLALLVSTIIFGRNPSGQIGAPQLWLGIGDVFFQPSELLKIILVAFLASYLAEQAPSLRAEGLMSDGQRLSYSPRVLGPMILMWGLSVVILVWQRDLGTAVLFFAVFLVLLYVASGTWWIAVGGAALILVAGFAAYQLYPSVVGLRIDIWLNPWPEADGRAYQIVQSLQAFAAGGVFGEGIGQGLPVFIPVVHSDFIFAALAEEYGLLGVFVVLVCIAVIAGRGLRIASLQKGAPFKALLAIGLSTLLTVQSLMIMGGVIRLLPLTGVTLPFMSYGGSSLLTSFVIIGLLLRLSAEEDERAVLT
ncbi:MAG: FtsW/RodA/SpoVE family cell cycle protein [Anaerolineae bacterium]